MCRLLSLGRNFCWIVIFPLCLIGCDAFRNSDVTSPRLLTKPGNYFFPESRMTVVVQQKGQLQWFEVKGPLGHQLLLDTMKSEALSHWFVYFDEKTKRLWRYSDDAGFSYWDQDRNAGHFPSQGGTQVKDDDSVEIPEIVLKGLPDKLQREYGGKPSSK